MIPYVYTAVAGAYPIERKDIQCFAGEAQFSRPELDAKPYKILPHLYLPAQEITIWTDANVWLEADPHEIVRRYLGDADIALFRHPFRKNVWEEFAELRSDPRFDIPFLQEQLRQQEAFYRAAGLPAETQLYECSMLIRRNNERVNRLMDAWWAEITRWHWRDQVSLPYVLWKYGAKMKIHGIESNIREHADFSYVPHYPQTSGKIAVFYHCAHLGEHWQGIDRQIMQALEVSGLRERADIFIRNDCKDTDLYELPTIEMLRRFAEQHDYYVLYVHTKGVTKALEESISDWRACMLYWMVERWQECVEKLQEGYDAVGINHIETPVPHFQGNFWWAKTKLIRTLGPVDDVTFKPGNPNQGKRHKAEFWLLGGEGRPNVYTPYHHHLNPYTTRNPRTNYEGLPFSPPKELAA